MSHSTLRLNGLSFERADTVLFNQLNFSFSQGRYGLVGHNGVGKSTLAKLICGTLEPDRGEVVCSSTPYYFEQFEKNESHLSGGEWMKIRLARLLSLAPGHRPEILILDEPTNNLDASAKKVVLDFIDRFEGVLILISHDREALRHVDQIVELTPQGLKLFGGDFDFYWEQRTQARERAHQDVEVAAREKRKREKDRREEIASQEKRIRRGNLLGAKGGIPKIVRGMKKRQAEKTAAKIKVRWDNSVDSALNRLQDAQSQLEVDPFLRLDFESAAAPSSKVIFACENLQPHFDPTLWRRPLTLQMKGTERWRIEGTNGSGKSSLLRMIGHQVGEKRSIAWLDQNQSLLDDTQSVLENVGDETRFTLSELRNELAFFGFTKEKVHQRVSALSGGERLRAALAKLFLGKRIPEVLLLDEPTNNFDFQSMELLERAISHFRGLLVIVSHDDEFAERLELTNRLELPSGDVF